MSELITTCVKCKDNSYKIFSYLGKSLAGKYSELLTGNGKKNKQM